MNRFLAYACLALSMSLVGSYVALSKPLVAALPVFLLAWLRFGLGGLAMLHWLKKPAGEIAMSGQTKRLVFLESFLGNFLFSICMLYGVSLTSAVAAGVIMAAIPAAVAVMSWLFLRERISPRVWASVACAVIGISLVSLSKNELSAPTTIALEANLASKTAWLGNLLLVGAVLCEAAYAVIGKKLTGVLSPKRITALINLWGFALVTPFGLWMAWSFDFASVAPAAWGLLLFYSLAASVWTVWLWMSGLKTIPANQAGVFTVLLPVSAAAVGVLVLGEQLSSTQIGAFAIALTGVLLATLPQRGQAASAPPVLPH
ncbi:Threonine/homoserine efflux transporter RhtA [Polaromonas sp. OV174]|uniref:DMT family transporter n=1 Tax=Polaromonas sp. OV174 TaxID=1855300 RepID=UPI0008F3B433|nr:DMT family transporter [Polaromonas sp. OV174]SFC76804.1 Threonine/homoserine efflux transporter RhtA [Polaromonas sp. OV174]